MQKEFKKFIYSFSKNISGNREKLLQGSNMARCSGGGGDSHGGGGRKGGRGGGLPLQATNNLIKLNGGLH